MKNTRPGHTLADAPGEILPGALYRAKEAYRRLGWSLTAARSARRDGLALKYRGGKAYVTGDEIIRFISTAGKDTK